MNYYYDVVLNWSDEDAYEFYEWDPKDALEMVKKIPLFRVNCDVIRDFLEYCVVFDEPFLESIKGKTVLSGDQLTKVIDYAFLVSDGKNAVAIECNKKGETISISKLLIDEELTLNEMIYNLKESTLPYQTGKKRLHEKRLRQEREMKQIISREIDDLYQTNFDSKLKYLFLEWFGYEETDREKMMLKMKESLEEESGVSLSNILDIIRLSYKKSLSP